MKVIIRCFEWGGLWENVVYQRGSLYISPPSSKVIPYEMIKGAVMVVIIW
jgi:hypothetical protein